MSHQQRSQSWKDTVAARPNPRDIAKTMHLSLLSDAKSQILTQGLNTLHYSIHDFNLFEIKGRPEQLTPAALPAGDHEVLWLGLQFHGKSVFSNGHIIPSDSLYSFITQTDDVRLTLPEDRIWKLLIGVSGTSGAQLLAEIPDLRKAYEERRKKMLNTFFISYLDRQALESLFGAKHGPFSTLHHIGLTIGKLFGNYTAQLTKPRSASGEEALVQIYHRALEYIGEHYLSKELTIEKIADVLACSIHTLRRAFRNNPTGVKATILKIRLYKGRELLQTQSDLSIESIAQMLHFSDARHFATQYKKCFYRTPSEDRKRKKRSVT